MEALESVCFNINSNIYLLFKVCTKLFFSFACYPQDLLKIYINIKLHFICTFKGTISTGHGIRVLVLD